GRLSGLWARQPRPGAPIQQSSRPGCAAAKRGCCSRPEQVAAVAAQLQAARERRYGKRLPELCAATRQRGLPDLVAGSEIEWILSNVPCRTSRETRCQPRKCTKEPRCRNRCIGSGGAR